MVVDEIMTRNPTAIEASSSLREAMRALAEADFRHLPVVEDGTLIGILSDRDIRSYSLPEFLGNERQDELDRALEQPVSSIMSGEPFSVDPETDVGEAVDLMLENKVGAIPVVEPDSLELVGIVSYIDALRAARELF